MSLIWTAIIFLGVCVLLVLFNYYINPYYSPSNEPASWSSGIYTD